MSNTNQYWDRYGTVSMNLDLTATASSGSTTEKTEEKAKAVPKDPPTIDEVCIEEPGQVSGRYWGWCLNTHRPLNMPQDPMSPEVASPPFGQINLGAMMKERIPINMVGAGLIYFNAARYSTEKFEGMLSMMEIRDIPKGEFVFFSQTSEDPLKDGYITQWRFVSKEAYQAYHHVNMAMHNSPEKKKCKRSLIKQMERLMSDEMKKFGRGKKVKAPKKEGGEEGEEEEEEEEEEEDDGSGKAGTEALNTAMQMSGRGRNLGEWGLGFGFCTESEHFKIYRLWSRPIYHHNLPAK